MKKNIVECIIIGGGQSGLAAAYFLKRKKIDFLILDNQQKAGGAWHHTWDSLRLFSPAEYNSLPGRMMPRTEEYYPQKKEIISYLESYETRYEFPIKRPVTVNDVRKEGKLFELDTKVGKFYARSVISATGTWSAPYIPYHQGQEVFQGIQIHSADYKSPHPYQGKKVAIVGGANSAAQILADIADEVAEHYWITEAEPKFLPDEVDGKRLFQIATMKYQAKKEGKDFKPVGGLGDIVMMPSVKKAREKQILKPLAGISKFTENSIVLKDGRELETEVVIWCTGFGFALDHLKNLGAFDDHGQIPTNGTKAKQIDGLWLVGYGNWTGYASATIIGVGRTARATADEVVDYLQSNN